MIAIFLIFGSDLSPTLLIANNSGKHLTLKGELNSIQIPLDSVVETPFPSSNKTFVFVVDNEVWTYNWIPVSRPYYQHRQYYMQIEPDGKLYALSSRVNSTVSVLPPQPIGYPLEPSRKKVRREEEKGVEGVEKGVGTRS
jgi:hypothetical protein